MDNLFQSVTINKRFIVLHVAVSFAKLKEFKGSVDDDVDDVPVVAALVDIGHLTDVEPVSQFENSQWHLYWFHYDDGSVSKHICTEKELDRFINSLKE